MRGGAGTALVGDPATVARRMLDYAELGIDTFILSGYPHLEEAYRVQELLFPLLPVAHRTSTLANMRWGIATARRAWLTAADVANTRPWPELERLRKSSAQRRR